MDNKFKIFNHSRTDSAVIEFKKNSDGVVEFPFGRPDSIDENRTAIGFCVSIDPFDSRTAIVDGSEITLTSFPIGVVGWIDVETADGYTSYRYEGLTTYQRKVDWLEIVTDGKLSVVYTPNGFKFKSSFQSDSGVKVRFRDEDIPYGLGDFKRVANGVVSPLNDGAQVFTSDEGLYMFFEGAGEPEPEPGPTGDAVYAEATLALVAPKFATATLSSYS